MMESKKEFKSEMSIKNVFQYSKNSGFSTFENALVAKRIKKGTIEKYINLIAFVLFKYEYEQIENKIKNVPKFTIVTKISKKETI